MRSYSDVIEAFGDRGTKCASALAEVGEAVDRDTVFAWKMRDSIPPQYWKSLVAAAERQSVEGVTFETLAAIAARGKAA